MSRGADTGWMAELLVRAIGKTILLNEAHSSPAGRRTAAELLRAFSTAFDKAIPGNDVPALFNRMAAEIEAGTINARAMAETFAHHKEAP